MTEALRAPALDHLVVAASTLAEGVRWLEDRLGVDLAAGGRHAAMGTHNRLLSLGPGAYLEVIAIDPEAPAPGRPRWFALDAPAMRERLAAGPALVHWVVRVPDIEGTRRAVPDFPDDVLDLGRGDYRWRIGVPSDGALPGGGAFPTIIQWLGGRHPAADLPETGCSLELLTVRAPAAASIRATLLGLGYAGTKVEFAESDAAGLSAFLRTPCGMVILPETSRRR